RNSLTADPFAFLGMALLFHGTVHTDIFLKRNYTLFGFRIIGAALWCSSARTPGNSFSIFAEFKVSKDIF
ncbi:MAG: hypothetical protein MR936_19350, partial [Eubacterium sp.]|nr:hypothetical protein [Eubacterium sp.]